MDVATLLMIAIGAILLLLAWRGWHRGLVRRVIELLGLLVSFLLATRLAPGWSPEVADALGFGPRWAAFATWTGLFLGGLLLTRLLAWAISRIIHVSVIGWADRVGGAVLGVAIGVLVASLLLVGATSSLPGGERVAAELRGNPVTRVVYAAAPALYVASRGLVGSEDDVWREIGEGAREQLRAAGQAASGNFEPAAAVQDSPAP
jgi:hypothetical protein